ncbi:MAG TPA: GNAT family N-acetyltransferase [Pseudonocardiaceae bacterium]|nr:GNAT family N-acetyltransferase [Pseudonocardiaceae bacterium]
MLIPDIRVDLGTPATLQELEESLFRLYYDAFSKPPYTWPGHGETEFRRGLSRLARDTTLGIVTAQTDNELIGFAYGHALPADTHWWDGFITPVPEEVTQEREGRTFALIDFVVAEAWRGRGTGRRLHDTLLGSRPESRATLAVEPVAHEARALYGRWGWRIVGRLRGPATDFAPEFDIMVRDLPLDPH